MTGTSVALELRPFEPGRDFPGAVDLISDTNAHDAGQDWYPTVESLMMEWAVRPGFDPARDAVVVEDEGRIVAGGTMDWRERAGRIIHSSTIWVLPEWRRRGLGRRILAWLEARARASLLDGTGGPPELPHVLNAGIETSNIASAAFAAGAGYAPVRYGFQMRRPLDLPIPDVPMPAGLEVRPVEPAQIRAIWEADSEAFQDHFEPRAPTEAEFERFTADPDCDISLWLVAWDGDEVAGSVLNGIYPHENAATGIEMGWLDHVSVRRQWRGRGLAKALIVRSLALLRERGMEMAVLGVDAENPTGALQVYEGFGFRPYRRWATLRKPF
ncbi:MAG: GNAT family N-acetyltransferase [Chloroflexi bacterium]|nr:GNAT family N-acetyltransferase [Chloroflexota bacterium]